MGAGVDTQRHSGNYVRDWLKRKQIFVRRRRVIAAAVLLSLSFASSRSYSECTPNDDDRVALELASLGKQGETIARARRQALEILQNGNACTAWFQEADPAPAEVFRSLHLELESKGPDYINGSRDDEGGLHFRHPWAAEAFEYGGRNSIVRLNANGAFFKRASIVMQADPEGAPPRFAGFRQLVIPPYAGNTPEAQITILLHELGHVVGLLPADHDPGSDQSSRNTSELLRHCQAEVRAATRKSLGRHTGVAVSTLNVK
jgi:hypothetical protein